jgi:hypothetical protein
MDLTKLHKPLSTYRHFFVRKSDFDESKQYGSASSNDCGSDVDSSSTISEMSKSYAVNVLPEKKVPSIFSCSSVTADPLVLARKMKADVIGRGDFEKLQSDLDDRTLRSDRLLAEKIASMMNLPERYKSQLL